MPSPVFAAGGGGRGGHYDRLCRSGQDYGHVKGPPLLHLYCGWSRDLLLAEHYAQVIISAITRIPLPRPYTHTPFLYTRTCGYWICLIQPVDQCNPGEEQTLPSPRPRARARRGQRRLTEATDGARDIRPEPGGARSIWRYAPGAPC